MFTIIRLIYSSSRLSPLVEDDVLMMGTQRGSSSEKELGDRILGSTLDTFDVQLEEKSLVSLSSSDSTS